jgi:hypothetical protein
MASKGLRAITCQVTQNVEAGYNPSHTTETLIGYIACYRLVFFVFCHFFSQFATPLLSIVRLGRQALWLVLVVCQLVRPANVLDLCVGFNCNHK